MKSSKLLLKIKRDLKPYKSIVNNNNKDINENIDPIHFIMSKYNQDNFNEIMNLSPEEVDEEIDGDKLNDFKESIEYYFKLYAPNDDDFKEFIIAISMYLSFIAKKPLHPPGITFSDGNKVLKKQNNYYCTRKTFFIQEKYSLCRYCVCKPVQKKRRDT